MSTFRTMIVSAADADLARTIAATLDPANSSGMFETGLSATGTAPATHYVSTGYVSDAFAAPLPFQVWEQVDGNWLLVESQPGDAWGVAAMCQEDGLEVTPDQVEVLFEGSDITDQEPFTAFGRLGLQLVQETVE